MKKISSKKKLLIFGNYGVENVGDEAILAGLISGVNKKKWDITVVSVNPNKTKKDYKVNAILPPPFGIRSLLKFSIVKTLKTISSSDIVIFGGGGLFQDKEKRAFVMWAYFLKVCQLFKKRIAIVANTIGPINKKSYQLRAKKLFKKISFFSVRDQLSVRNLKQLNVPDSKISISTDAAFFLRKPRDDKKVKREILFILHGKHTSNYNIIKIKKFVQQLKKKNEKLLFIPMQLKITNDQEIANKLGIKCFKYTSFREVFIKISQSKLVVTSRLHGVILSIISGVSFIAFSPMEKVENFLKSAGLEEYFLKSLNDDKIMKIYNKTTKKRAVIIKEIAKVRSAEKDKTKSILPDFL